MHTKQQGFFFRKLLVLRGGCIVNIFIGYNTNLNMHVVLGSDTPVFYCSFGGFGRSLM